MSDAFAQRMFDAAVRVERMFWIAGICADPPHEFQDFLDDELEDAKEVLRVLPWIAEPGGTAEDVLSEFAFKQIDGFIVQLATPIPYEFHKKGGGYAFTWRRLRTCWFFFPSLDALCDRAETWAAEVVEAARKEAA